MKLARTFCDEVEFSAEDASRSDYGYLKEILQAVFEAGARTLNVPDTVGYALPPEYADMVRKLVRDIPGAVISVHCHNDLGLAVANSLAAVQAGARQVECTINGIGERAGNTSLEELVMALKVRREVLQADTGVRSELLDADQHAALDRDRRLAPAQQGDRRPQRLRPRGGDPPARHARQPALLRDHDPGERGPLPVDAHPRQALREARRRVAPQAARRQPEAGGDRGRHPQGQGVRRPQRSSSTTRTCSRSSSTPPSRGRSSCATR